MTCPLKGKNTLCASGFGHQCHLVACPMQPISSGPATEMEIAELLMNASGIYDQARELLAQFNITRKVKP